MGELVPGRGCTQDAESTLNTHVSAAHSGTPCAASRPQDNGSLQAGEQGGTGPHADGKVPNDGADGERSSQRGNKGRLGVLCEVAG